MQWEMETVGALTKANLTKHVGAFISERIKVSEFGGLDDAKLQRGSSKYSVKVGR